MSEPYGMNTLFGTKWFTFYTKIRPWIVLLFTLVPVADFLQYTNIYLSNPILILSLATSIAQMLLCIWVRFKSDEDYRDFVRFVKGVLIFETCNMTFQQGIQQYYVTQTSLPESILITCIVGIIMYFIWYRLNIKYFRRRIMQIPNHTTPSDLRLDTEYTTTVMPPVSSQNQSVVSSTKHSVKYCSRCGSLIDATTKKCSGCGKQYFRGINHKIILIIFVFLFLVSLVVNIKFYFENTEYMNKIILLEQATVNLETENENLTSRITNLITDKTKLQTKINEQAKEIIFYDKHIVFIEDDGTKKYHKYDCQKFVGSSFWAYNLESAKSKGYKPCSLCCD